MTLRWLLPLACAGGLLLPATAPRAATKEGPDPMALVDVRTLIPDAVLDLRYATDDNFMKQAVYPPYARCLLRRGTAERLARVAEVLRQADGTRLLLYDCYRPLSVQRVMWSIFPVRGYVAPPSGGSIHNRGAAVDLGLAAKDGTPLPMPTPFDTFSREAWPSYDGATPAQTKNRDRLRRAMLAQGFTPIRKEWWHYEDPALRKAPLMDEPFAKPRAKESAAPDGGGRHGAPRAAEARPAAAGK